MTLRPIVATGAILTNLDEFQLLLCLYFVGADSILLLQVMYYDRDKGMTTLRVALAFGLFVLWSLPAFLAQAKWSYDRSHSTLTANGLHASANALGVALGWCSAFLYIGARFPQIVGNLRGDDDVMELNLQMFATSIVANVGERSEKKKKKSYQFD